MLGPLSPRSNALLSTPGLFSDLLKTIDPLNKFITLHAAMQFIP